MVVAPAETNVIPNEFRLTEAFRRGFKLKWRASTCTSCRESGGSYGFDFSTSSFSCFCPDKPHAFTCNGKAWFGDLNMGNEMGNNNTSGLKEEENTTNEACKISLVDSTHEIDAKEEHQLVPEVEGKEVHEKVANMAYDDPERIGDPSVEEQTSSTEEHQNPDVHPLGQTPEVTVISTEAGENDSKLQSDTSPNDLGHEKPKEKNTEETDLQETMDYQLEKHESFKKDDEENVTISTSNDLEPKENITVETYQTSSLDSTHINDINEENQIGAEVEENSFQGKAVAYLAPGERKMIEDPSIKNQKSSTAEQEDTEVPPLGELQQFTMESTEVREEDSEVLPVTLSSDSGTEQPLEQKQKEIDIHSGTMQYQLDKPDILKKDDEEDGTISVSHDLEDKESMHLESSEQDVITVHTDQCVEVGTESLLGRKDSLGPSFASDFEANGHVLDTETSKDMEENDNSSTVPALERKEEPLLPVKMSCEERLKSSEEQLDTRDGEEVESGVTNITPIALYVGLQNKYNVELPTEMNSIDSPEALLVSNSHLEVPELKVKCIILNEEIRTTGQELDNGDKHYCTNQIHPSLQSEMESEPDCDKSSDPQSESTIGELTYEKIKTVEHANLVLIPLSNQQEASEVVPELGIISPDLTIEHFSQKEDELVGKTVAQEREDTTEPSLAIEMEETEQNSFPPEENTVFGNETVQSIKDPILEAQPKNSGECFATENPTTDFTSWIAEALVSMNNLEAEILGQQVTQQNEAHEAKAAAADCRTLAEVETSSVSVSTCSETQETVGRSSTVSTESDPDNLNIGHAQIQKSPSFNLDLQNEPRTEESDITPLLHQDKTEIESSASQGEKVIALERSESEEPHTPFLGFLKEEEQSTHVVVVAENKHEKHSPSKNSKRNPCDSENGKATPTSSKDKETRRHRPSLFSNCLCCATVIN